MRSIVAAALVLNVVSASASIVNVEFEALRVSPCSSVAPADLPTQSRYVFQLDFDRLGVRTLADGTKEDVASVPGYTSFYADLLVGNYLQSNTTQPQIATNFGGFFGPNQESGCLGTFNYASGVSMAVGRYDDQVGAMAYWSTPVTFTGPESLLSPGARWYLWDNGQRVGDTFDRRAGYEARIVSITPVSTVQEPGVAIIVLTALGAMLAVRRLGAPTATPARARRSTGRP